MGVNEKISILIIDDEEPIRRLLAMYLSEQYTCHTAASADEATEILASGPFNLVITDIAMPGTSGIELSQYINQAYPETVVIMVSGMSDINFAIESMRHGAFDYLTKPFDLSQVMMAVDRALRYQGLVVQKRSYEQSLEEAV